jgi:hypothetical protein
LRPEAVVFVDVAAAVCHVVATAACAQGTGNGTQDNVVLDDIAVHSPGRQLIAIHPRVDANVAAVDGVVVDKVVVGQIVEATGNENPGIRPRFTFTGGASATTHNHVAPDVDTGADFDHDAAVPGVTDVVVMNEHRHRQCLDGIHPDAGAEVVVDIVLVNLDAILPVAPYLDPTAVGVKRTVPIGLIAVYLRAHALVVNGDPCYVVVSCSVVVEFVPGARVSFRIGDNAIAPVLSDAIPDDDVAGAGIRPKTTIGGFLDSDSIVNHISRFENHSALPHPYLNTGVGIVRVGIGRSVDVQDVCGPVPIVLIDESADGCLVVPNRAVDEHVRSRVRSQRGLPHRSAVNRPAGDQICAADNRVRTGAVGPEGDRIARRSGRAILKRLAPGAAPLEQNGVSRFERGPVDSAHCLPCSCGAGPGTTVT